MRAQTLLLSLAALSAWTAFAAEVSIPVENPKFTADELTCNSGGNCYYSGNITNWLCGPQVSLLKGSTAQYKNAPPEGLYAAVIGGSSGTGSIFQTLGDSLLANTTYVLQVTVGARADTTFTGYLAGLVAGNDLVARGNSATPVGGDFVIETITYNSGAAPPQLGKPLQIFIKSLGTGQVSVAAVTLTATSN